MKNILIIADGILAKKFLEKLMNQTSKQHKYFVVYSKHSTISKKDKEIDYYNFDPTSYSKLNNVLRKYDFYQIMIIIANKNDCIATYENIRKMKKDIPIFFTDRWNLNIDDKNLIPLNTREIVINQFFQLLPDVPIIAQNIGFGKGEIVEVRVPFGSSFLYRHIYSVERSNWRIAAIYRNKELLLPSYNLVIEPNDVLIIIGNPAVLKNVVTSIKKEFGQFPKPFGSDLYFIIDFYKMREEDIEMQINNILLFHSNLNSRKLILKIINPTLSPTLEKIKRDNYSHIELEIEFVETNFKKILQRDIEKFDIGMIVVSDKNFNRYKKLLYQTKVAILKMGKNDFHTLEEVVILNSDSSLTEKISSVVFDISNQLGFHITLENYIVDNSDTIDEVIYEHFESLSEIFGNKVNIKEISLNPIRDLLNSNKSFLHCLPFSKKILKSNFLSLFSNDVDRLYFKLKDSYQLFIPVD